MSLVSCEPELVDRKSARIDREHGCARPLPCGLHENERGTKQHRRKNKGQEKAFERLPECQTDTLPEVEERPAVRLEYNAAEQVDIGKETACHDKDKSGR